MSLRLNKYFHMSYYWNIHYLCDLYLILPHTYEE